MFSIVDNLPSIADRIKHHVYLVRYSWDDWNKFQTMFTVYVVDADGVTHEPGSVKIGEVGLAARSRLESHSPGYRAPTLPTPFDGLEEKHFSIGQSENYYETLNELDFDFKNAILSGLRDCAFNLTIFDKYRSEYVMSESLLRGIQERNVRNRLHRLAHGNAVLTQFEFEYVFPDEAQEIQPPILAFSVIPDSEPPTNVHILIGRNGVGKTRCIQNLYRTVFGIQDTECKYGSLNRLGANADDWSFAGLVSVSFSVFDDFDLPVAENTGVRSYQVGLRKKVPIDDSDVLQVKTPEDLAKDFTDSLSLCRTGPRAARWRAAIDTLEADPLFKEANISELLEYKNEEWTTAATKLFRRLSSGHAIVLLTITRLVELVDERTLVILDEPEGHLHPPLLAALIRAVADLLGKRNGVALIATHSPVVLQEVPRSCAWKLNRSGILSSAERPAIETFGENVSVLTGIVFGLEVTRSGFHSLLTKAIADDALSYDKVLEHFSGQLGSEARSIARGLIATRDKPH
ncbi:MAG: AAA family ATPase [Ferrovum myxofaciens]